MEIDYYENNFYLDISETSSNTIEESEICSTIGIEFINSILLDKNKSKLKIEPDKK